MQSISSRGSAISRVIQWHVPFLSFSQALNVSFRNRGMLALCWSYVASLGRHASFQVFWLPRNADVVLFTISSQSPNLLFPLVSRFLHWLKYPSDRFGQSQSGVCLDYTICISIYIHMYTYIGLLYFGSFGGCWDLGISCVNSCLAQLRVLVPAIELSGRLTGRLTIGGQNTGF